MISFFYGYSYSTGLLTIYATRVGLKITPQYLKKSCATYRAEIGIRMALRADIAARKKSCECVDKIITPQEI